MIEPHRHEVVIDRITSYNVCYTKLLRISLVLSLVEVLLSTNALEIVVEDLQRPSDRHIVSDEEDEPADGRV